MSGTPEDSPPEDSPPVFLNQLGAHPQAVSPTRRVYAVSPPPYQNAEPPKLGGDFPPSQGGSAGTPVRSPTPPLDPTAGPHVYAVSPPPYVNVEPPELGGDFPPSQGTSGGTPPQQTTTTPGPTRQRRVRSESPSPPCNQAGWNEWNAEKKARSEAAAPKGGQ